MDRYAEQAVELWAAYWPKLAAAAVILFLGGFAIRIIAGLIRKGLKKANLDAGLTGFLTSLARIALWALVIITVLGRLGIETTTFAAVVGAAGLAVGFALQGSLGNFAAGVMLLFFRPFKVGDFVEAGGTSGAVTEITIFSTILTTPDNKRVIVPNSAVTGNTITNYSAMDTRRVDLVFGIGYGDDLLKAKRVLEEIIQAEERVLKDPAPVIKVLELADSSVNFAVRPWTKTADYWGVYFELTEQVKLRFDAEGISIPFPQTDVHLHKVA